MLMKKMPALLTILGMSFVYAFGVVYFYRALEDSPYSFNLGMSYPAGIDPDFSNRLSLCWDIIVLAACITFLAVAVGFVVFVLSLIRNSGLFPATFRPVLPFAWLALLSMVLILGVTFAWGLFARQDAASLFTQSSGTATYLTMRSWMVLVICQALALFGTLFVIARRPKSPMRVGTSL